MGTEASLRNFLVQTKKPIKVTKPFHWRCKVLGRKYTGFPWIIWWDT